MGGCQDIKGFDNKNKFKRPDTREESSRQNWTECDTLKVEKQD